MCQEEWQNIHQNDLWIANKLFLSRALNYNCGPAGVPVSKPDFYIIRPSLNLMGMSRFARFEFIESDTEHLHPSEFWCEIFKGEHLSVDFYKKKSKLVVIGENDDENNLYKWKKWKKIEKDIDFPEILDQLHGNYDWINCEFIEGNLIEVHFRRNPDFRYGNNVAVPIWMNEEIPNIKDYQYVEDPDYLRQGFLIK